MSDSDSDGNNASDADSLDEFDDGLDENLIRDEEDRKRLFEMTEKEREQELFNRIEKREVLKTRSEQYNPGQNSKNVKTRSEQSKPGQISQNSYAK